MWYINFRASNTDVFVLLQTETYESAKANYNRLVDANYDVTLSDHEGQIIFEHEKQYN